MILYKGEWIISDLDSYPWLALHGTLFRGFMKLHTKRFTDLTQSRMSDVQFSFKKERWHFKQHLTMWFT